MISLNWDYMLSWTLHQSLGSREANPYMTEQRLVFPHHYSSLPSKLYYDYSQWVNKARILMWVLTGIIPVPSKHLLGLPERGRRENEGHQTCGH